MGFLDDMTSQEKDHLEEALQRWKRAEDRVPHRVQVEYTQRFPLPGNADHNLWQALQNIYARQLQERAGEPWLSGPSATQAAAEVDLYNQRYVVLRQAAESLKEGTLVVLNDKGEALGAITNIGKEK